MVFGRFHYVGPAMFSCNGFLIFFYSAAFSIRFGASIGITPPTLWRLSNACSRRRAALSRHRAGLGFSLCFRAADRSSMSSSSSEGHISFFHWRSFRLPAARRRFLSLDRCLNTMRHLEGRQIFLVSSSKELILLRFRRSRVSVWRWSICFLAGLCVRGRELLLLSCTTAPPPAGDAALLGGRGAGRAHLHLCRRRLRRRRVFLRLLGVRGLLG